MKSMGTMMPSFVYLNDAFIPENEAKLSIFDRATLFADSIYEVCCFIDGMLLDFDAHMARLQNSLNALDIQYKVDPKEQYQLHHQLIERNQLTSGIIYLQISRGVTARNFQYDNSIKPSLFMFATHIAKNDLETINAYKVISVAEERWARRNIKTTQLLCSSLAKTKAIQQGVNDAIYVENGFITEATSANFHIITQDGTFVTRQLDGSLLPGITRAWLLKIAHDNGIHVEERPFTLSEVYQAKEAFLSSAGAFVRPVIEVDGKMINDGQIGEISQRLFSLYKQTVPRS